MNIVFLSHIINEETPLYAGKRSIALEKKRSIQNGDSCNMMHWSFPNHTGTHMDAPLHFVEGGMSITDIEPKDLFFNKIALIEIPAVEPGKIIGKDDMIAPIKDCEILLLKTGFEDYRDEEKYWKDSPALHFELAEILKKKCPSIRAVGVDFISISNLNNRELGKKAHQAFLRNNILLIEDMKLLGLRGVPDSIIVSPLLVEKADGSPCTVSAIYN